MGLLGDAFGGFSRSMTAGLLGMPVDLTADALNLGVSGLNAAAGLAGTNLNLPTFQNPVGGSAWIAQKMRNAGMLQDNPGSMGDLGGALLPMFAMPINPEDLGKIRGLLGAIEAGKPTTRLTLDNPLTPQQFSDLQAARQASGLPAPAQNEFQFRGSHLYNSRSMDGYTVDDMMKQLESGTSANSVITVDRNGRVNLQNPVPRDDGYGNQVNDTVTFELSGRPEIFSVIPKGDRPRKK